MSDTLTTVHDVVCTHHPGGVALTADVEALHEHIVAQPGGKEILSLIAKSIATQPKQAAAAVASSARAAGSFNAKMSAVGSLVNLVFYQRVTCTVQVGGRSRTFTANCGGFSPGFPGGFLAGDLYYNDINDVSGTWDVQCGAIGPYYSVQFIKGGVVRMSFQAGNVGFSTGIVGGKGSWE